MIDYKQLMIGDWVQITKDWYQLGKVTNHSIQIDLSDLESIQEGMYEVKPIPLTEEIMNRNGFEYNNKDQCWVLDKNRNAYLSNDLDYNKKRTKIISFDIMGEEDLLLVTTIEYIHQLQHLLRLLEIDKEIEL
jgi:hypothetical protein